MKNQNLLPALIDKTKKIKLTAADSLKLKKADSIKKVNDSLRIKGQILKKPLSVQLINKPSTKANKLEIDKK